MSEDDVRASYDDGEETARCPIQILGHRGRTYYYVDASGQMTSLRANQHSEAELESLFGGDVAWLQQAFPIDDDKAKRSRLSYNLPELRAWLFQDAREAGIIDPDHNVRGPGVWRNGKSGLIVHCGDQVLIDGEWQPAGCRVDDIVYPATRPEPKPADTPASAGAARELLGFLDSWNWRSPPADTGKLAGRLWLGWAACGFVAGALKWRPHILVSGPRGTGKNALQDLMEALFGTSLMRAADPSPAGIRQALLGAARPVSLNEIEHDAENNRAQLLVELARLGSSDGEGAIFRGSPDGNAQSWVIRACFYFSAILYPAFKEQDASRITVLDLAPLEATDEEAPARLEAAVEDFARAAPGFKARMIFGFERFLLNLDVFRQALAAEGADSRQCDQFGALLAAAETLISDEAITASAAEQLALALMPSQLVPDEEEADHVQAAFHLLTFPVEFVDYDNTRERRSLGDAIAEAVRASETWSKRLLGTYGLAVKHERNARFLVVANQHRGLEQVFFGTRWRNRVWQQAFRRFAGAERRAKAVYFGGGVSKGTWVPIESLPDLQEPKEESDAGNG